MATDRPPQKILAPPAVLAAVCIGIAAAAEHFRPWPFFFGSFAARLGVSTFLFAAFGLILLMALRAFRQHHTTVSPYGKATALVTSGPFRFSRNPIYVGLLLVAVAFAVALASAWQLVGALLLFLLLHFGVILPEERFLAAEFGDEYRDYARRVRRWL